MHCALRLRRQLRGSGFPDEATGIIRDWQTWQPVDRRPSPSARDSVTAIQLAQRHRHPGQ